MILKLLGVFFASLCSINLDLINSNVDEKEEKPILNVLNADYNYYYYSFDEMETYSFLQRMISYSVNKFGVAFRDLQGSSSTISYNIPIYPHSSVVNSQIYLCNVGLMTATDLATPGNWASNHGNLGVQSFGLSSYPSSSSFINIYRIRILLTSNDSLDLIYQVFENYSSNATASGYLINVQRLYNNSTAYNQNRALLLNSNGFLDMDFYRVFVPLITTQSDDEQYIQGYNDGYYNGKQDGYYNGYNNAADYYYDLGERVGKSTQAPISWQEGYNQGILDAANFDDTAFTIMSGIMQVGLLPVNVFLQMFEYEIFGVNIAGLVSGLLTIAITLIVIRVIVGGNKND